MSNQHTPRLQLALDEINSAQALRVAKEACRNGAVDLIEAGTPLIKSEGLEIVRRLKQEFPKAAIVADMKTMDAGRLEVEIAAKSGASLVMVLGAASESTLRDAIEAGRNYGVGVGIDLVQVADYVGLAKKAAEWSAALVSVHCPIDLQMQGMSPFAKLREVAAAVSIPVAVAGGINSETAAEAVASGASIVVVGGAITKAVDACAAADAVKLAMSTGRAVATDLFKRGNLADIREIFGKVSTPNISDAMHRGGALSAISSLSPGMRMIGPVVTVRTYPGDWAKPVQAITEAKEGEVIVVDARNLGPAVWGELATESCMQRRLAGVVVWGAVRDVDAIRTLGFPTYSSLRMPNAGEPKGFGEINVPIVIDGQRVEPGDWAIGDDSGVVIVPAAKAVEIANRAMDVFERENRLRKEIRNSRSLAEVAELLRWEKK
jgi:3-hexulose-6-phosphate synthase/6-phospho-3-hexuloisomerase